MAAIERSRLLGHCRIASFVGWNCHGNAHRVEVYSAELPESPAATDDEILVEVVLPRPDAESTKVRFSQHGRLIARCGSGTLAAAHALQRVWHVPSCRYLNSSAERLETVSLFDGFGYIAYSLRLRTGLNAALAATFFSTQPTALSASGPRDGYLIAEFATADEVCNLEVDHRQIEARTRRAVIATARANSAGHDYVMRYFAPQYGVTEDPATGSANQMAAHYWQNRLNLHRVRVRQASAAGGECWVEALENWCAADALRPRRQLVAGRTVRLD